MIGIPALGLKRKQWEPLAFASPSLALIALVIVFPLVYSFYLSFRNFDLSVGPESEFIGGRNYAEALLGGRLRGAGLGSTPRRQAGRSGASGKVGGPAARGRTVRVRSLAA